MEMSTVEDRGAARPIPSTEETRAWVAEMMAKVADGSIWREVARQPRPEEIVDRWRRSRTA
jgi:hypothetical protein